MAIGNTSSAYLRELPGKRRKLEQATKQTHELHFTFSDKNAIGEILSRSRIGASHMKSTEYSREIRNDPQKVNKEEEQPIKFVMAANRLQVSNYYVDNKQLDRRR